MRETSSLQLRSRGIALVVLASVSLMAWAQFLPRKQTQAEKDRELELFKNHMRLNVEMIPDKETYFAGEEMVVRIEVSNPTAETFDILEPFHIQSGAVYIYGLLIHEGTRRYDLAPVIKIRPGEVFTRTIRTGSTGCGEPGDLFFVQTCSPVTKPGRYHLIYDYPSIPVPLVLLNVVSPTILSVSETPRTKGIEEREWKNGQYTGRMVERPVLARLLVLAHNEKQYLGIHIHDSWPSQTYETLPMVVGNAIPWYRLIAETEGQFDSVTIRENPDGGLVVKYLESSPTAGPNQKKTLWFNNDRERVK